MKTNYLVTGATGFIGRKLVQELLSTLSADPNSEKFADAMTTNAVSKKGFCRIAVRSPSQHISGAQSVVIDDIGPNTDWRAALRDVDVVVHLAAHVHQPAETEHRRFFEVNTQGTIRLAEQAAEAGVKRFVFISTINVHGDASANPIHEYSPFAPTGPYGESKLEAERQLRKRTDLEVTVVRPPLVYGACSKGNFPRLVRLVRAGIPLPLGSLTNQRSMLFVGNLVRFIQTVCLHPDAAGETFVISDRESISTPDLITAIARAEGRRSRLLPVPLFLMRASTRLLGRSEDFRKLSTSMVLDSSRSKEILGWRPPYSFEEALSITLSH
ncbi:MAG: NAD-dependent epimerase/dehydratase family protein [Myxococcota bacterium]